jgi:hypothetical protein
MSVWSRWQGLLWLAIPFAGLTALSGWFTAAWRQDRAWAWWAWAVLGGTALLWSLADLLSAGTTPSVVVRLVVNGTLLALLAHPDSVARIRPAAPSTPLPGPPAPSRRMTPELGAPGR